MSAPVIPARFYAIITWSKRDRARYVCRQVHVRFSQLETVLDLASDLRPIAPVTLCEGHSGDTSAAWDWSRSDADRRRVLKRSRPLSSVGRP